MKPGPGEQWCPTCGGEGHVIFDDWRRGPGCSETCDECEGTGIVDEPEAEAA